MAHDDPQRMHARRHGDLDKFLVLDRQGLAARDPRHVQPRDQADAEKQHEDRAAEDHQHQDQHEHEGNGHQDIDGAHHDSVQTPAVIARDRPIERADDHSDQRAHDPHHQRDAGALHCAGEEIAAVAVGAEVVAGLEGRHALVGIAADQAEIDEVVFILREDAAKEREGCDANQQDHRHDCGLVAQKARSGIGPERAALDLGQLHRIAHAFDGGSVGKHRGPLSNGFSGRSMRKARRPEG